MDKEIEKEKLYLVKIGEIALKGGNRKLFERQLKNNILKRLHRNSTYTGNQGRYYLTAGSHTDEEITAVLGQTFGITGFNPLRRTDKTMEAIEREILSLTADILNKHPELRRFKVESRRSDKGFPLSSYDISARLGAVVLESFPSLTVDLYHPDFVLHCEVREKALVFTNSTAGPGGLPVGCAGKGTLLLSGGIDSPVAGYLMAKRGLKLDAVYFHTPPFTSDEAKEKVEQLAALLSPFCSGLRLFTVPFTDAQLHMKKRCKDEETTLLMRACMMTIADRIGKSQGSKCLVTGEALSQVASQTVESITYTGSYPDLTVFRPLIGYDKEEIIDIAKRIGTFEISIRPYDDCCSVFSPERPIVKPDFSRMRLAFEKLEIDDLLSEAADNAELKYFGAGVMKEDSK